ncbi:MAG: hypothetical protein F6J87_14405 [Spirulina sp. SIO3F2]|nr:hypothetical protein [Spirulina sp. SIO3F2]
MALLNQGLKVAFEAQYPNGQVQLSSSDSDGAIARLLDGDIDLAAIARPLTPAEQAQGLEAVFVSREKMAIVVGPENSFAGDLSFAQFAQIFRGEITDWSEVGGEPGPIRLVDRPDTSDMRRSLGAYAIFQTAPFATGETAIRLGADDTAAMIAALGDDGLGYVIASQVRDLDTVKIVPMHQTLPDDPRYPYSQPRGYVYRAGDDAAKTLAFLGLATSATGQAAIATAQTAAAETVAAAIAATPQGASNAAAGSEGEGSEGKNSENGLAEGENPDVTNAATLDTPDAPERDATDNSASDATATGSENSSAATTHADDRAAAAGADGKSDTTEQQQDKAVPWWLVGLLTLPLIGLLVALLWRDRMPRTVKGDRTQTPTPTSSPPPLAPSADMPSGAGLGAATGAGLAVAGRPASEAQPEQTPVPATPIVTTTPDSSSAPAWDSAEPDQPAAGDEVGLGALAAGAGLVAGAGLAAAAQKPKHPPHEPTEPKAPLAPAPVTDKETPQPVAPPTSPDVEGASVVEGAALAAGLAVAALGGERGESPVTSVSGAAGAVTQRTDCEVQHLTVDNRRHCFALSQSRMAELQNTAASERLEPGTYVIRIKAGSFNDNSPRSCAQPMVMLWIYGGSVINHKTRCQVPATWSSLNGYDDSLTLTVVESCVVSALFFDSYVEDNTGEVVLAIAQLYT